MLQTLAWHVIDTLTRAQFTMLRDLADKLSLSVDDRRSAISLSEQEWEAWAQFQAGGPLPAQPSLSAVLHQLAEAAFHLSVLAEDRDILA